MLKQLICTETSASEQQCMTSTSKLTNLPLLYPSISFFDLVKILKTHYIIDKTRHIQDI